MVKYLEREFLVFNLINWSGNLKFIEKISVKESLHYCVVIVKRYWLFFVHDIFYTRVQSRKKI